MRFPTVKIWRIARIARQNIAATLQSIPNAAARLVLKLVKPFTTEESDSPEPATFEGTAEELKSALPNDYKLVYQSKDGNYCLYTDSKGRLVSADARKFV